MAAQEGRVAEDDGRRAEQVLDGAVEGGDGAEAEDEECADAGEVFVARRGGEEAVEQERGGERRAEREQREGRGGVEAERARGEGERARGRDLDREEGLGERRAGAVVAAGVGV